tara:strand:+ start:1822 stop:2073 length:252 start_codon:yes stop_codon:yes gene_type:complete
MSWFKSFINWITPPPKEVDEVAKAKVIKKAVKEGTVKLDKFNTPIVEKPQRARTKKGTFVADDKSTPDVNEAWVGGKAPKKKK